MSYLALHIDLLEMTLKHFYGVGHDSKLTVNLMMRNHH